MTIHSETNVNVTLAAQKAATWGTKLVDGSLTQRLPLLSSDVGKQAPMFYNDAEEVGKGHADPTRLDIEGHEYSRSLNYHLEAWLAAWVGAFGLGKITSAGPTDSAYTHTCLRSLRSDDNGQLPWTTIVEENDSDDWYRNDIVVGGFELSGQIGQRPTLKIDVVGSGKEEDASAFSTPAFATANLLKLTGLQFQFGVAGALVDLSSRLRTFKISHNNNLDVGNSRSPGCGLYAAQCLYGDQRPASLEFTVIRSGVTELTQLKAATQLQAVFTFTGGLIGAGATAHSLTITFTALKIEDVDITFDNKRELFTVKPALFYTAADQGQMKWVVVNGTAGFAVAEA